jgi:DHA1 family tetracycline resistance protein-like MFS transporter
MKDIFSNKAFLFITFSAFLAVIGIGIIIPVIPFIVQQYLPGADAKTIAFNVGLLTSIYSFCQFFAAPGLGALSDKYGRRPILLLCLIGSAIGYILFGIGGSLAVLFLGRIIDGLTGGDISTMFAYIADVTKPEERGKLFGFIGATVGVGFMIGPSIGGLLAHISLSAPFYLAAVITLINAVFGYFVLPESLKKEHRMIDFSLHHLNPFSQLQSVLSNVTIRTLLFLSFFYFLPFAQLQGIGGVFSKDVLHWNPANIGFMFLVVGIVDIFTQGVFSHKLMSRFGEMKLMVGGLALTGIAYALNASNTVFHSSPFAYFNVIIFAFGGGLIEPALGSLISRAADPREQGRVQGANQSLQSITRIVGPLLAAFLYSIGASVPYIVCALLSVVALFYLQSKYQFIAGHIQARDNVG